MRFHSRPQHDFVHWSVLESLASLCHHRLLFLPDGSRLVGSDEFDNIVKKIGNDEMHLNAKGVFRIPKSFRLVLIGDSRPSDQPWLNETVIGLMPFFALGKLSIEDQYTILRGSVPAVASDTARKLVEFVEKLRTSGDVGAIIIIHCFLSQCSSLQTLSGVAYSLSMRKLIHIAKRDCLHRGELRGLVEKAALARFLPSVTRLSFYNELDNAGFEKDCSSSSEFIDDVEYLINTRSEDHKETMIPNVVFYENNQHMAVIRDMARDMRLGAHLLLIGNQGVGKNKITDRFLHLIQRPRHYMQLHRDTTVESITMQTTVENGILRYEDSPLVRAARAGHILVVDEADKAPLHVIAVFKSLLDSGMPLNQFIVFILIVQLTIL
ncbi:ATPase family protein [Dictyocaulus viviparus]|uniref:ATPase family protein n=1 Tax=Dictyocaulus viviparus TaxID=29172 RepID=A0A0D8XBX9_DICVI|nr:ATPase family protein [Dictyocaulus viviparus]